MNAAAWARAKVLLADAADLPQSDRERFIVEHCADVEIRREVLELLASPAPLSDIVAASSLPPGTRLGPYVIERLVGAGGMGEVYRASDTRLDRTVAIKVLPAQLANDPRFRERFEREARAISALSHPHICALYDIGAQNGIDYLVMEYVDGETLASRLASGPIPMDQIQRAGIEIADALDHAHREGIIHRDLKPGNIILTRTGAKLLDFGLAKLQRGARASAVSAPVGAAPQTAHGDILGTFGYMAPEQLDGIEADARADIFALGAILFEMATGNRAVDGHIRESLIAAVHKSGSTVATIPARSASSLFHKIVLKCLATEREARWQSAFDLVEALHWIGEESQLGESPAPVRRWRTRALRALVAVGTVAAVGTLAFPYLRGARGGAAHAIRFVVAAPQNATLPNQNNGGDPALSSDGRRLAFVAVRAGTRMLWVRALDALDAQPLAGTEGATYPFWAPDNQTLAFFSQRTLKTISADGGMPRTLCDTGGAAFGGSWSPDGNTIAFGTRASGVQFVPAAGGSTTLRIIPDVTHEQHLYPTILPDGRHFTYLSLPSKMVWLGSVDSTASTRLLSADSQVQYVAPGYLVFVRKGTLMAQRFDAPRAALVGEPVPIARVRTMTQNQGASFAASPTGVLVYRSEALQSLAQLTWVDRTGHRLGVVGQSGNYRNPELSPDGASVALEVLDSRGNSDVSRLALERGVMTRLTADSGENTFPVWSPDGRWIMFSSDRQGGVSQLYRIRADGTGGEELVRASATPMIAQHWPSDELFVYQSRPAITLGVLPLVGGTPYLFDPRPAQGFGQVSPDGRWLAYASSDGSGWDVYVQSFPKPGRGKWQISKNGGVQPRWSRDGREIFYYTSDGVLMAVPVMSTATELGVGAAVALFEASLFGGPGPLTPFKQQYDVTRDGRFLLSVPIEGANDQSFTVVVNWTPNMP